MSETYIAIAIGVIISLFALPALGFVLGVTHALKTLARQPINEDHWCQGWQNQLDKNERDLWRKKYIELAKERENKVGGGAS